ncbi:hypothetical protein DTW90_12015 [Neorhizobium sp. P12A]|nr:hypothetical protein DTW90_12015 [Neorhizobium sp. P12A]
MAQFRRAVIEGWIEQLIALLDELDGDENMESELAGFSPECMDDREGDDEREDEPAEMGIGDQDGIAEQFPSFAGGWGYAL